MTFFCGALLCLPICFGFAGTAVAEVAPSDISPTTTVHVALGKSEAFSVNGEVERIVLAQPEIAQVDQSGPRSLFIIGREIGATNLLVFGPDARLLQVVNIEVGYDADQLRNELAAVLPDEHIKVSNLNGGLLLRGSVSTPQVVETANDLAERAAAGHVISILDVRPDQVLLEVQLIEASEDTLRDVGLDFSAAGSGAMVRSGPGLVGTAPPHSLVTLSARIADLDLDAVLRGLEQRGSARILARPQILALSGEKASFRSGGEFPFPVPTRDGLTIEFKPYGTAISVLPTVQNNGLIRLDLAAEVSSIDPRNSLRVGGLTVPALITRRALTTLELRDGERFVFAGLFSEAERDQIDQTPWAAEVPLLGRLFKASNVRRQRLQLAIIVTARLIEGPNDVQTATMDPSELLPARTREIASVSEKPPRSLPERLLARIGASPVARTVSRQLTAMARMTLNAPKSAWTFAGKLARRLARPDNPLTA